MTSPLTWPMSAPLTRSITAPLGTLMGAARGGAGGGDPDYFAAFASQDTIYSYVAGPHSVYYNGRTYTAFQGPKFDIYMSVYVHATGQQLGPYWVRGAGLTGDAHGIASIIIDDQGYIHVWSGCHVTAMLYTKSTNPEDASAWTNRTDVTNSAAYPTPFQTSDNTIWVFYRAGGHANDWAYKTSTDRGATWSAATSILSGGLTTGNLADSYYVHIKQNGDDFHVTFLWKDDTNSLGATGPEFIDRYNCYYMKLVGGSWLKADGGAVSTFPVTKTYADSALQVYNSYANNQEFCQTGVLVVDGSGVPHILFNTGKDLSHVYKFARWNGSSWTITSTGVTTDYLFDDYNLEYVSGTTFKAYLVTGGSSGLVGDYGDETVQRDRGGNVEEWTSTDSGANWIKTATIATATDVNNKFNSIRLAKGYQAPAKLIVPEWGGDADLTDFSHKLRMWSGSAYVRFAMEAETKALLARFSVTPSAKLQSMMDSIIRNLKNAGVWSLLDWLYLTAQDNATDAKLNWVGSAYPLTNVGGGPTFTQYAGFTGNGTSQALSNGFLTTDVGIKALRNDNHFSVWANSSEQSVNADAGFSNGSSDIVIRCRNTANQIAIRSMSATTEFQTSVTDAKGLTLINRTGASAGKIHKNGTPGTAFSAASVAPTGSFPFWYCGLNAGTPQYSARPFLAGSGGASLTDARAKLLQVCMYMWNRATGAL